MDDDLKDKEKELMGKYVFQPQDEEVQRKRKAALEEQRRQDYLKKHGSA